MSLKSSIATAAKWSILAELASKGLTPIIFVVLAWLLTPKDFGLIAIATMIISFAQIFWDAGLSKALIQRQKDIEKTANIVFWTNAILGILIYVLLLLSAGFIAHLFNEPLAEDVIKIQGIQIILASLCSVQTALFKKDLNFKPLFYVRLLTTVLPGLASIPLAWGGLGYWALVVGTLVGALGQLILLWLINPWRPKLEYDKWIARQLISFSLWVTGEGFLSWGIMWLDALIIGAYLGTEDLGLYRTGNAFVLIVFSLLLSPLLPVLFSSFSRLQDDRPRMLLAVRKSIRAVSIISIPTGIGFFITGGLLEEIIFEDKWSGIGAVIGWMGLMHGISWLVGVNSEAYRSIGRADLSTKIMMISLLFYLPTFLIAAQYSLEVFLIARFVVAIVAIPIHIVVSNIYLNLRWTVIVGELKWIILSGVLVGLVGYGLSSYLNELEELQAFLILVPIGLISYLLFMFKEWNFFREMVSTVFIKKIV